MGTVFVSVIVFGTIAAIVLRLLKKTIRGESGCGCSCGGCASCSNAKSQAGKGGKGKE